MSDSRAATGFDRLPWLADEPKAKATPPKRGGRELVGWVAAAFLLVGGASFWLGSRSEAPETQPSAQSKTAQPSATVPLPPARSVQEVAIGPQPQVSPAPAPEVRS